MITLNQEQKEALCASIRTTRYARKVVALLRDFSDALYKTDSTALGTNLESSLEDDLLNVLRDILRNVDEKNAMEAEEAIRSILDYINSVPEVEFIVPVHPSKDFLVRLFTWCSEHLKKEIFLDITTNRMMTSGLIMIYKGNYFEYALENMLDEYFESYDMSKNFVHTQEDEQQVIVQEE